MATPEKVNSWYNMFAASKIKDMGINLYNQKDLERLRVPTQNGEGTEPLFKDGFKNTNADKERLYNSAMAGVLFAFNKEDNKPYQITENSVKSCDKEDERKKKNVPLSKKIGYRAVKTAWALPRFGLGLAGRVLNLLTLGLFKKQIKAIGRGFDMMTGSWSERLFSVKAQRREREERIGIGERIGNFLTLGTYKKEKIAEINKQRDYENIRKAMSETLDKEKEEWKKITEEEIRKKEEESKKSQVEKEIEETESKLDKITNREEEIELNGHENEIKQNEVNEELEQEHAINLEDGENRLNKEDNEIDNEAEKEAEHENTGGDNQTPEERGNEMKSKLLMQYEEMRMAFAPEGGGLEKAVNLAKDMNQLIERLKNDPEALEAIGMKEENFKKLSNMCTNMNMVFEEGLEARIQLMKAGSQDINPEQRRQYIQQVQLMNLVERAMVNSACAAYQDNGRQPGMDLAKIKNPKIVDAMYREPEKFKQSLYSGIQKLESTRKLEGMSSEALAEFISKPENVRAAQTEDIRKTGQMAKEQQQRQLQIQKQHVETKQQQAGKQQEEQQLGMVNI